MSCDLAKEILFLPKNTTSKIQPIDAGIIASFKLHYHHLQLQHAIDHDEARENDIYKTIKNCWVHTKIISPHDESGMPIISESRNRNMRENLVEENLNLEGKENMHQQFTDDDFVQGAIEVEQGEEKKVVEPFLSPKEKLAILHEALKIVVEMVDDNRITMKSLHKIQTHIRKKVQREKNE
ncbi:6535_t:CDS:2, partial [Cetraspora pellucida]